MSETCPKCGRYYNPQTTVHCDLYEKCHYAAQEPEHKAARERRYDLRTPIIRAIYDAVQAIEACGASEKLTHAVILTGALMEPVRVLLEERDEAADAIAALRAQVEAMTEPGKASAFVRWLFDFAQKHCAMSPNCSGSPDMYIEDEFAALRARAEQAEPRPHLSYRAINDCIGLVAGEMGDEQRANEAWDELGALLSAAPSPAAEDGLVERLMREWSEWEATGAGGNGPHHLLHEAAARIERQAQEIARRNTEFFALVRDYERLQSERDAALRRAEALREALRWYAEKAEALARYSKTKPQKDQAMMAVVTELILDAGKRASPAETKE